MSFASRVTTEGDRLVVFLDGELDMDARVQVTQACTFSEVRDVTVDLSGLSFMDCSGFGALCAARQILQRQGGCLRVRNCSDQPARLLSLFDHCHDDIVDHVCDALRVKVA